MADKKLDNGVAALLGVPYDRAQHSEAVWHVREEQKVEQSRSTSSIQKQIPSTNHLAILCMTKLDDSFQRYQLAQL